MLKPESWAVIAVASAGIVMAVMAFLRTPAEQRFRVRALSAEERLAASPPEARAVIIRADRRRALRRDLPWFIAAVPLAAFAIWLKATHGQDCASLFGIDRVRLAIWALFALPPVMVAIACAATAKQVRASLRGGYWPPLDVPQYVDTLAVTGAAVRRRLVLLLLALTVSLALIGYGYARLVFFPATGQLLWRTATTPAACAHVAPRN